jgi:choline-sulfatase
MKAPNILFLMTDQHRADVAGFAGDSIVRTPVLDRLAADAVVFTRAYTPSPVCVPGRQCLMSGRYPWNCGCRRYGDDLAPFSHTFAAALAEGGYETVCAGKLHHMGADQMQGWTRRIGMDTHVDFSHRNLADPLREQYRGPSPWPIKKELEKAGIGTSPYEVSDDYAVDGACRFIREYFSSPFYERNLRHRPILLKVSLNQPHYPFVCNEVLFDYYREKVPAPDNSAVHRHPAFHGTPDPVAAPAEWVRNARAAYYGMVEQVDSQFGRVIQSLENEGEVLDDWIIVFTSDHGDLLGDHGLWWKHKLLEASVRVPLFIRYPRKFSALECSRVVSLCDLFTTLCDLAGIPAPENTDSRSLIPLLAGTGPWTDLAYSEINGDNRMLVSDSFKLVESRNGQTALFDLRTAEPERRDCSQDPQFKDDFAEALRLLRAIPW